MRSFHEFYALINKKKLIHSLIILDVLFMGVKHTHDKVPLASPDLTDTKKSVFAKIALCVVNIYIGFMLNQQNAMSFRINVQIEKKRMGRKAGKHHIAGTLRLLIDFHHVFPASRRCGKSARILRYLGERKHSQYA